MRYNEVPPEHGLMVQQIADAVYESAGSNDRLERLHDDLR